MRIKGKAFLALALPLVVTAPFSIANGQERHCPAPERTRIIGGERARMENWPGQGVFRIRDPAGKTEQYFCGGTAVSDRWVLSAAHCFEQHLARRRSGEFDSTPTTRGLEVVLGSADLTKTDPGQAFRIERIIIHERYRDQKAILGDDIALVRLASSWSGPVATLSLSSDADPVAPAQVRVAGFGLTERNQQSGHLERFERADGKGKVFAGSPHLLEAAVEAIPTPQCQGVMTKRQPNSKIGAGQVCAGVEQGRKDSCKGDSGGPLVIADARGCPAQIGIVSWGSWPCADEQEYGVYTRVSHYADWIQKHTGPLQGAPPRLVQTAAPALTGQQLDQGLKHLEDLLGPSRGRVSIGVRAGNRVRLGDKVVFEAASNVAGKLIIMDINANREVVPVYPNKYVPTAKTGSIAAGQRVTVPGPDYPGFTAFQAVEPTGKGRLLAIVVPPDFDVERFVADAPQLARGFQAVNDPPSYLMRVIRQIEVALGSPVRATGDEALKGWGYAMEEYEIVR